MDVSLQKSIKWKLLGGGVLQTNLKAPLKFKNHFKKIKPLYGYSKRLTDFFSIIKTVRKM